MFSPSLLAMILHAVGSDLAPRRLLIHRTMADVASDLDRLVRQFQDGHKPMPSVPVIGHTTSPDGLRGHVTISERLAPSAFGAMGLWGRIPVDVLVARLQNHFDIDSTHEYLDLGTPLAAAQQAGANMIPCASLLNAAPAQSASLRLAVIDRGEKVRGGTPFNFGGRVHHLNTQDVVFDDHAAKVLETLLERLNHHGVTPDLELIVGLVSPPGSHIGSQCFKHSNTVELLDTLRELMKHVGTTGLPVVTNLSMGTHVGPHRGDSPLEEELRQNYLAVAHNVLVCSSGNDGMAGIADSRTVHVGVPEFLRLRTDSRGCGELLIELWWDDAPNSGSLTVSVEVRDHAGRLRGVPMSIGPNQTSATSMQAVGAQFNTVTCKSLYHARCLGTLYCIAFAMSAQQRADLADLTIDIEVLGNRATVQLDAWVVLAEDQSCSFVGGGVDRSVCVPATMPEAVSVAGVTSKGQPWRHSSRGAPGLPGTPSLAHLVNHVSGPEEGTSFAAPRVTADIVERMRHSPAVNASCAPGNALGFAQLVVADVLGRYGKLSPNWNPRVGWGAVSKGP